MRGPVGQWPAAGDGQQRRFSVLERREGGHLVWRTRRSKRGLWRSGPVWPLRRSRLDPPCSDDDLHGEWLECKQYTTIRFDFPLADVAAPVEGLRLVFLPLDSDLGVGGWGGAAGLIDESLDLYEGGFSPLGVGGLDGETFDLNESAEAVAASSISRTASRGLRRES